MKHKHDAGLLGDDEVEAGADVLGAARALAHGLGAHEARVSDRVPAAHCSAQVLMRVGSEREKRERDAQTTLIACCCDHLTCARVDCHAPNGSLFFHHTTIITK